MADHLENMAMELQCPVCLSLLDSSVSLVCNHVFCNSCILNSMKRTPSCPVCKVPFRRREVRPAPHMDSLVNIYKNMKTAAGVNTRSTQITPSVKNYDEDVNVEDETVNAEDETVNAEDENKTSLLQYKKTKRGKLKRKSVGNNKRKKPNECNVQVSGSQTSTGPSFPMNKRVRVTPYFLSETPVRPEKNQKIGEEFIDNGTANSSDANLQDENNGSAAVNETVSLKDNGGPMFSPFFSLREDYDGEEDPMQPSSQQTADNDMPEIAAPCFSDIKDSDSGTPEKMTQTSEQHLGQLSDCKVFETRRSCSPDLCTTPVKQHDPSKYINSEKENQEISMGKSTFPSSSSQNNKTDEECEAWVGKKNKRSKTRRSGSSRKCSRISIDDITADNEENPSNSCDDMIKSNKGKQSAEKSMFVSSCMYDVDFAAMEYSDKRRKKHLKTKNAHQKTQVNRSNSRRSKHFDDGLVSCKDIEESEALFSRENNPKVRSYSFSTENKIIGQMMQQKPTTTDHYTKTTEWNETCLVNKPSTENTEGEIAMDRQQKPLGTTPDENHHWLKKCSKSSSQIKCAFCKSSVQTEVSGEMMHYFKCKPVASDYNGGNNILHSHKYCTEWAPNVYFDKEIAVNLTDEVTRSRRISCGCCGMKGAALGCFEKSCRKSFHFTCAKLVPECKWDNENFVMLCPLHSSSKLPCEVSLVEKKKKKTNSKGESQVLAGGKADIGTSSVWKWPLGSSYKWVFCCSALNGSEKEIVAKFTKLTGFPVSKTWTPNVTHVIASTDDKGACKRTLKVLMGIIEGKWILKIDWLKTCLNNMEPVDEKKFEVSIDNHGIEDGPRLGRLRVSNEKPKLFRGFNFYFMGDFTPSYKGYLRDLVTAAGGTVLQRKPILKGDMLDGDTVMSEETYIIYSREIPENQKSKQADTEIFMRRQREAQVLADSCGAKLATNTWLLNSIAASTLQSI